MKISLPIYGQSGCANDVLLNIQLTGNNDFLILKCHNRDEVWGDDGIYCNFGLLEFDTDDIKNEKSHISDTEKPCIDSEKTKFIKATPREMREYFDELVGCFK